jgi:hypothetical protein
MRARIAWAVCALSVAAFAVTTLLFVANFSNRAAITIVDPYIALGSIAYILVGALIVSRHSAHALGWLMLGIGVTGEAGALLAQCAIYGLVTDPGSLPAADWALYLGFWLTVPAFTLQPTLLLLLFPSGRLIGWGARLVGALSIVGCVLLVGSLLVSGDVPPESGRLYDEITSPLHITTGSGIANPGDWLPLLIVCALASITIVLRRLRRSRGLVRQQLKWIVYAMALVVAMNILDFLLRSSGSSLVAMSGPGLSISAGLVPVAIGIAILRYQLFDIDRVISRTLVYGVLSGGLALIYLGGVLVFQRALDPLTSGSDIAIAATTLLVAALARPLRNRVQRAVDRRFYRRHYDAVREIEHFAARLREQTDLDELTQEIRSVVYETMQPRHISLWIPEALGRTSSR